MKWFPGTSAEEQRPRAESRPPDSPPEPRALIERAQHGDHQAFAELLQLHQRRVFSLIGHLVRQPAEVEDIAQEVFLKVYRALGRFDFRASFATWLYRIAVNECYDYLRRRRAQKAAPGNEVPVGTAEDLERLTAGPSRSLGTPGPAEVARRVELRQMIEQLFRRLPADDQLLLSLRELEGLSMGEIAALLKLRENTVKVRLFRARQRLLEAHRRWLKRTRRRAGTTNDL